MIKAKYLIITLLACFGLLISCQDEVSDIGGTLTNDEVTITVDSMVMKIDAAAVYNENFDGRNVTKLLGRLRVPEYGSLDCSFVTQMMSATSMNIPDSITEDKVDSIRLILTVPVGSLTGDSLAPQQLKAYRLDKQLPSDINTGFDPSGYYSQSGLMGTKSYTISNIAKGDSAMKALSSVRIPMMLNREFGLELFRMYRADDPIFQWPATFNQWFPGIYVEQNFGNGCVANISRVEVYTYWNRINSVYEMLEDSTYGYVDHIVRDSVCLLGSQPEVLSSNVIKYKVADSLKQLAAEGKSIITTPGGYTVDIKFPIDKVLEVYNRHDDVMSVVSSLKMEIPAVTVTNDYGITVAPYLLMVKKSEKEKFFAENKVPDSLTSFYASYSSDDGSYQFNSMRAWFLEILDRVRNGEEISDEDIEFTLVPVDVTLETVQGYSSSAVYVTSIMPYLTKPTMTLLDTDNTLISFVYSSQELK